MLIIFFVQDESPSISLDIDYDELVLLEFRLFEVADNNGQLRIGYGKAIHTRSHYF